MARATAEGVGCSAHIEVVPEKDPRCSSESARKPKKEGAELQNDGGGDRGVFSPPSSELRVLRTVREGPEAGADVDQTDHALP